MSNHAEALHHAVANSNGSVGAMIQTWASKELRDDAVFPSSLEATRELADLLLDLGELKSQVELAMSAISEQYNARCEELSEMLVELDEPGGLERRGFKIKPKIDTRWSPAEGTDDDRAARYLRDHDYPDIAKFSVHWKRFNSVVEEVVKNNDGELPEALAPLVKSFKKRTVSITKGK